MNTTELNTVEVNSAKTVPGKYAPEDRFITIQPDFRTVVVAQSEDRKVMVV